MIILVPQQEFKQAAEFAADADSVEFVVRAGDIPDRDSRKCLMHVLVIALRKKKPVKGD